MLSNATPHAVTLSAARLVIHAEAARRSSDRYLASALQWMHTLYSLGHKAGYSPLRLQIADLQGNVMLASDDTGPRVDVSLPAGTYQVTAWFGTLRRDYTLTLKQGTAFDLYLRLATEKL